ncbi:MAG: 50S ribosomal protein L21 [Actinobacteria bacterium]|nr:50S ribosomal protein L21 [Actinomycetota bacterium]
MYAVIKTGGKQYRVSPGDVLEVEHLTAKGDQVTFSPILVVTDKGETIYGSKDLKPFPVKAKLVGDAKGDKVTVQKYRPKSGYNVKSGHRQLYSVIEITSIGDQTEKPAAKKPAAEATPKVEKAAAADAAEEK